MTTKQTLQIGLLDSSNKLIRKFNSRSGMLQFKAKMEKDYPEYRFTEFTGTEEVRGSSMFRRTGERYITSQRQTKTI